MGLRAAEDTESRFVAFVDGLVSVIGHADRAGPLRDYCTGLVMPCERKSVEPMAAVTAPANVGGQHQSLLHFVGEVPWSYDMHFPQSGGAAELGGLNVSDHPPRPHPGRLVDHDRGFAEFIRTGKMPK
jgi:hypothetical protein